MTFQHKKAQEYFDKGCRFMDRRKLDIGIINLKKALSIWPENPAYRIAVIRALMVAEKYEEAFEYRHEIVIDFDAFEFPNLELALQIRADYEEIDSIFIKGFTMNCKSFDKFLQVQDACRSNIKFTSDPMAGAHESMITAHIVTVNEVIKYFKEGNHEDIEHFEIMIKALFKIIIAGNDKIGAPAGVIEVMGQVINTKHVGVKNLRLLSKAFATPKMLNSLRCL